MAELTFAETRVALQEMAERLTAEYADRMPRTRVLVFQPDPERYPRKITTRLRHGDMQKGFYTFDALTTEFIEHMERILRAELETLDFDEWRADSSEIGWHCDGS